MDAEERLDNLLSTVDSGFNSAMQEVIREHTVNKPKGTIVPDDYVIDYMEALHKAFFFCRDKYKRPYSCISFIKKCAINDEYLLHLVDSILHLISTSEEGESMLLLYGQLIDFRHELSPWDEDAGVKAIQEEMDKIVLQGGALPEEAVTMEEQFGQNTTQTHIINWENRINDFVYTATRYRIDAVHAEVRPGLMFSAYFQDHVLGARLLYEKFKQSLRQEVVNGGINIDFYRRDIGGRFLPKINSYEEWYNAHRVETEIFGEYNPYSLMWNVLESTRDEIYKYFPELEISTNSVEVSSEVANESLTFSDLLIGQRKEEIVLLLAKVYTDRKARFIGYMLYALSDLGILNKSAFDDKTRLHNALTHSFGNIGTRTALNDALIRLNAPTQKHRPELQDHKERIAEILQPIFLAK